MNALSTVGQTYGHLKDGQKQHHKKMEVAADQDHQINDKQELRGLLICSWKGQQGKFLLIQEVSELSNAQHGHDHLTNNTTNSRNPSKE